jgi:hypothetical protein
MRRQVGVTPSIKGDRWCLSSRRRRGRYVAGKICRSQRPRRRTKAHSCHRSRNMRWQWRRWKVGGRSHRAQDAPEDVQLAGTAEEKLMTGKKCHLQQRRKQLHEEEEEEEEEWLAWWI